MISKVKSNKHKNGYPPDAILVNFMRERLRFERAKEKAKLSGKELAEDSTYLNLKKRKYDVLDRVFVSMANLIFFFKSIAEHPEIEKVFEDDLLDLLGLRTNESQMQNIDSVFYDLLDYIIIGKKEGRHGEYRDNRQDFRLILVHEAQKIVYYKMSHSSVGVLEMNAPRRSVIEDFNRAWGWTEMLSQFGKQSVGGEEPPGRAFDFRDHDLTKVEL